MVVNGLLRSSMGVSEAAYLGELLDRDILALVQGRLRNVDRHRYCNPVQ